MYNISVLIGISLPHNLTIKCNIIFRYERSRFSKVCAITAKLIAFERFRGELASELPSLLFVVCQTLCWELFVSKSIKARASDY